MIDDVDVDSDLGRCCRLLMLMIDLLDDNKRYDQRTGRHYMYILSITSAAGPGPWTSWGTRVSFGSPRTTR